MKRCLVLLIAPFLSAPLLEAQARADARPDTGAVRFMTGMIAHHAQAITMSQLAPARGAGRDVLVLAERIIVSQRDEIALMRRWLTERGVAAPAATDEHAAHAAHPAGALMPGMLSAAQLAELDAAHGTAFDRLFLTLMIQHHGGALAMVDQLLQGRAQEPLVFRIASDVHADQTAEIDRMVRMLALPPSAGREP